MWETLFFPCQYTTWLFWGEGEHARLGDHFKTPLNDLDWKNMHYIKATYQLITKINKYLQWKICIYVYILYDVTYHICIQKKHEKIQYHMITCDIMWFFNFHHTTFPNVFPQKTRHAQTFRIFIACLSGPATVASSLSPSFWSLAPWAWQIGLQTHGIDPWDRYLLPTWMVDFLQ